MKEKNQKQKTRVGHFIQILKKEYTLALFAELNYKWRILVWAVGDILQTLIFAAIWMAVAKSSNRSLDQNDIISYYFFMILVYRLTQDWSLVNISTYILSGEFSKYLIKPFNYLSEMLAISFANKTLVLTYIVPVLVTTAFINRDLIPVDITPDRVILFIVALTCAFIINFILNNTVALIAFYIQQVQGIKTLYQNTVLILSGQAVPIFALPQTIRPYLEAMPFRYIISFPLEILTGQLDRSGVLQGFICVLMWSFTLMIAYKTIYKLAIDKYEAEGI